MSEHVVDAPSPSSSGADEPHVTPVAETEAEGPARRLAGLRFEGTGLPSMRPLDWLELLAVAFAALVWWRWVMHRIAGDQPFTTGKALFATIPAVIATRPHLRVPARELLLAAAVPLTAVLVCLLAPGGWTGGELVGVWAYGAAWFVIARALCTSPARRAGAALLVMVLSLDQFAEAWLAYWGGTNQAKPMIGSYAWHNPFAAFVSVGAVLSTAAIMHGPRRMRVAGWTIGPLCAVSVVLSTSRSTMLLLAAAWLALGLSALLPRIDLRALGRWALAGAVSVAMLFLLTSTLFFPTSASPLGGTSARGESQSFRGNGQYRLDYWRAGAGLFAEHPLTGTGMAQFAYASLPYLPLDRQLSPAVHNGYLQALSDGGLLHGVPVVLAAASATLSSLVVYLRALRRPRRRRGESAGDLDAAPSTAVDDERWLAVGASVALGVVLLHGGVDFDFFFSGSVAQAAVLVGIVASLRRPVVVAEPRAAAIAIEAGEGPDLGPPPSTVDAPAEVVQQGPQAPRDPRRGRLGLAATAALVLVLPIAAQATTAVDTASRAIRRADAEFAGLGPVRAADQVLQGETRFFPDRRLWAVVVDYAVSDVTGRNRQPLPESVARAALDATESGARVDPFLAIKRERLRLLLGDEDEALAGIKALDERWGAELPAVTATRVNLLTIAGKDAEARALAVRSTLDRLVPGHPEPMSAWLLVFSLARLDGAEPSVETRCAWETARIRLGVPDLRRYAFPGSPPPGADCASVLRQAAQA